MCAVIIVGVCGKAGAGKSSVAEYLVKKYGATKIAFASPLKEMARAIWGFSEEQVYGSARYKEAPDPRTGIVPRWAMQQLGQAARDHLAPDVWIRGLMERVNHDGLWVVEDLRYKNEALAISEIGYVLRLHCDDSISVDAGTHPSEAEVDEIPSDHVFAELRSDRSRGLEHLFGLVDEAMERIL